MRNHLLEACYGITQEQEILLLRDVPVTNFIVGDVLPLYACQDDEMVAIELTVTARCAPQKKLCLKLSESICEQIKRYMPGCKLLKSGARDTLDAYILEMAYTYGGARHYYIPSSGLHRGPRGHWIYACGEEVLGAHEDENFCIAPSVAAARLAWKPGLDVRIALHKLIAALERHPQQLYPLYGYTLISSVRSQLMKIGVSTFPSAFLDGRQGYGKTVLAEQYSLLYDPVVGGSGRWAEVDASSTRYGI